MNDRVIRQVDMSQKSMDVINTRMTPQKALEIQRAIIEVNQPYVDMLVKLYSYSTSTPAVIYQDGRVEFVDPYLMLSPELQKTHDDLMRQMKEAQELVLRGYGIALNSCDGQAKTFQRKP